MKITSIPSRLPNWYDPKLPNFRPPKSWGGCRVRISVPVDKDPAKEMAAARKQFAAKYPGATLSLIPDFQKTASPLIDIGKADDRKVLEAYLDQVGVPENVTNEQVVEYLKQFLPQVSTFGVQGLRFRNVLATNVLCFEKVEMDLNRTGLTLVSGINKDWGDTETSNGAGKSSFVTLPFLPLFGRTFKGQTHDGWARQRTRSTASVMADLTLDGGRHLVIHRTRRPSTLSVNLDGRDVTMGDPNATQRLIESLTNLTWDVLTNSVYIGQREIGSIFGTEKQRKELFSRLLGLDRFLDAQGKLREAVVQCRESIAEVEDDISHVTAILEETQAGQDEIRRSLNEGPQIDPKELTSGKYELSRLRAVVSSAEKEIAVIQAELERNQADFETILDKTTAAETRASEYANQLNSSEKVEGQCPTCGSKVSVKALETYCKHLRTKLDAALEEADRYENEQASNRTVRRALLEKVQSHQKTIHETIATITRLEKAQSKLQEQLEARQRLEDILHRKEDRTKRFARLKYIHESAREAHVADLRFVEFCSRVVGRDGLPAYLCQIVVPALNTASVKYSQIFTDGEISIMFSAGAGDVDVAVVNQHGGESTEDQSAGEMRMASLIAALSCRDVLVHHNILVLDEPTEGMDAVNAERFAVGLNSVVDRFQHVIVIAHSKPFLDALEPDRHWLVTKENGIATVTEL